MTKKLVFCIMLICLITGFSFGQAKMGQFAIFAAVSLPVGDFGDDKTVGDGYATTGFGAGLDYAHPIGTPGLTWFSTGAFIYNGFDDKGLRALAEEDLTNVNIDGGSWINIPILTGLKYETEVSPTMDFFALGQVGLNFYMPPTSDITGQEGDETVSAEFSLDSGTSFGFTIGAGLVFNNKFNVAFRYLSLGEPEIEGTVSYPGGSDAIEGQDISIAIFLLTVGFNL
jgi:hypothetical protein